MQQFIATGSIKTSTIKDTKDGGIAFLFTIRGVKPQDIWCYANRDKAKLIKLRVQENISVAIIGEYVRYRYQSKTGKSAYCQGMSIRSIDFADSRIYDIENWCYGKNGIEEDKIECL